MTNFSRSYLIIFFLSFVNLSHANAAIDVVVDLDQTLVMWKAIRTPQTIEVAGEHYLIIKGASDLLTALVRSPGVRVSFFSGRQNTQRNHDLLSKIKLANGRSALDVAYRVLSREDLRRGKKDLYAVAEGIDLAQSVLIDNERRNAAKGQERNLLLVDRTPDRLHRASWILRRALALHEVLTKQQRAPSLRDLVFALRWQGNDTGCSSTLTDLETTDAVK